jgi:hypothetical protein
MLLHAHVQRSSSSGGTTASTRTRRSGAAATVRAFAVALTLGVALAGAPLGAPAHASSHIPVSQVANIGPSAGSLPDLLTVFDGHLYFSANDGTQRELWRTDGTEAGTA